MNNQELLNSLEASFKTAWEVVRATPEWKQMHAIREEITATQDKIYAEEKAAALAKLEATKTAIINAGFEIRIGHSTDHEDADLHGESYTFLVVRKELPTIKCVCEEYYDTWLTIEGYKNILDTNSIVLGSGSTENELWEDASTKWEYFLTNNIEVDKILPVPTI